MSKCNKKLITTPSTRLPISSSKNEMFSDWGIFLLGFINFCKILLCSTGNGETWRHGEREGKEERVRRGRKNSQRRRRRKRRRRRRRRRRMRRGRKNRGGGGEGGGGEDGGEGGGRCHCQVRRKESKWKGGKVLLTHLSLTRVRPCPA